MFKAYTNAQKQSTPLINTPSTASVSSGWSTGTELTGNRGPQKQKKPRTEQPVAFSLKQSSPNTRQHYERALPHVELAMFFHKSDGLPIYSHEWTKVMETVYLRVNAIGVEEKTRSNV